MEILDERRYFDFWCWTSRPAVHWPDSSQQWMTSWGCHLQSGPALTLSPNRSRSSWSCACWQVTIRSTRQGLYNIRESQNSQTYFYSAHYWILLFMKKYPTALFWIAVRPSSSFNGSVWSCRDLMLFFLARAFGLPLTTRTCNHSTDLILTF